MKVLFIGGTGIISTACTNLALERGTDLTLLNRGRHAMQPQPGCRTVTVDIEDADAVADALRGESFESRPVVGGQQEGSDPVFNDTR